MSAGKIRIITPLILAFVLLTSIPTFTGSMSYVDKDTRRLENHQDYAPDEIIIKFKNPAAGTIGENTFDDPDVTKLDWPDSLCKLNKKFRLSRVERLFKNFKANKEQTKALLKKDKALLTKREKHILQRLKRAPEKATVPALDRIYKLRFDLVSGQSIQDVLTAYNNDPAVEYAELNYIVSIDSTPNDPLYPVQWPLNNIGQMYPESGRYNHPPGTPDCDIDAPEAWDIYTGNSEVIVAVIDTGVDYIHRDLQNNMWVNDSELNGTAGVDDDGNGYVDDIYGYDFINNDGDPCDDSGHGTHCSGIIAAEGDNGFDITGVCWNARIMALKFLSSGGFGYDSDAVAAFYYAVENGADVTSNSWGGGDYSQTMKDAIDYAHSQGVIMVASAGNDYSSSPQYPAYYNHIISVAATNSNDEKATFSNYGEWIDIAAPGVDILSLRAENTTEGTLYDDYTTIMSGTSMACPHVAGACALLLSVNPMITCDEVYDILIETVDPISPGICIADGRLNLHKAIAAGVPSQGYISLDRGYYACSGVVSVSLIDYDLHGQAAHAVKITTNGGDSETLLLTKDVYRPGLLAGTISNSTEHVKTEDGELQVRHDQILTAIYEDANDGTGEPAVVTDIAVVDCIGPVVSGVQTGFPGREPRIFFETDEPTTARVQCGWACGGPYIFEATSMHLTTSHSVKLVRMLPETEYFYIVEASDEAGNLTLEDNGGECYSFTTTGITDIHVPHQCLTIQDAIDNSWDGGTVLVADGTYTGPGNRDINFSGRAITVRSKNEPENCIIDCNGTQTEPHRGFYFHSGEEANSVIKGFTITNGYAPDGEGGAIKCFESSPSIDNCIIRGNWAEFGGGVDNSYGSSPMLTECVFQDNTAEYWGGGMENWVDCNATLINCSFTGNAAEDGGAMSNDQGSDVTLVDCTFNGNSTIGTGGGGVGNYYCDPRYTNCTFNYNIGEGMYNYGSSPTIVLCQFNSNSSHGMGNSDTSRPTVINCTFNGNGECGIYNGLDCEPEVTNCVFSGNGSYGMKNMAGNFGPITNCTFTGNNGGIYNRFSTPVVTNCIIWGNGGTDEIEQIWNIKSSKGSVIINYCCVQGWTGQLGGVGNFGDDPLFGDGDGADDVYGTADDNSRLLDGSPCIDAGDNRAVPEDITDLDGDNDFTELLPLDFDGDLRFVNDPCVADTGEIDPCHPQYPLVDIGAFEGTKKGFLVSTKSVIVPEGNSVTFTVALLQDPCGAVEVGVSVESGDPDITVTSGELLTFDSTNYCQGKPVTLAAAKDSDVLQDITLIRISAPGFVPAGVKAIEGETVPVPTVLYVDSRATGENSGFSWVDAFIDLQEALRFAENYSHQFGEVHVGEGIYKPTIPGGDQEATFDLLNGVALRGGYAGFGTAVPNERDIEKYETILSGDLLGNDNTILENPMDMYDDPCRLENSWFIVTAQWVDETAVLDGFTVSGTFDHPSRAWQGAVYVMFAGPTLINCTIRENIDTGLFIYGGYSRITNCKFIQNAGSYYGGGLGSSFSELILTNCTFSGNHSSRRGGGIYNSFSKLELKNCTFYGNTAKTGGGMYLSYGSTLDNCIFWGNQDNGGMDESAQIGDREDQIVNYSCIQGWTGAFGGMGNIGADPLFVNDANGDYHLLKDSPCIDAGDPNYIAEPDETDLEGNPRVLDGDDDGIPVVDMGAYEMVTKIEVAMRFTPRVLNCNSKGKWVKAHFILPAGITAEDVDHNISGRIEPLGMESDHMDVFADEDGLVRIEMAFDRTAFCDGLTGGASFEITVKGFLTNGYHFYGKDTIKIINNIFEHLAFLSSQWLRTDCSKPDWCQGADIDQDSVVNLYDYTIMAEQWMEKE